MVIRELQDGSCFVSTQEDHAELSAQFAARWGNKKFSRLRPYDTMVFATTFHDSGYREWEGSPPINLAKGRPYAHRETIPEFEAGELAAYRGNVEWLNARDRYASLLVSMHRTGLWANRYDVFTLPQGKARERSAAVMAAKQELERQQEQEKTRLARTIPALPTSFGSISARCRFSTCCRFIFAATVTPMTSTSKKMSSRRWHCRTTTKRKSSYGLFPLAPIRFASRPIHSIVRRSPWGSGCGAARWGSSPRSRMAWQPIIKHRGNS